MTERQNTLDEYEQKEQSNEPMPLIRENTLEFIEKSMEKSKKINNLVKKQVTNVKENQIKIQSFLDDEKLEDQDYLSRVESVKDIVRKSEELIVFIQIIIKVRNELTYARLDLEKAKKTKKKIEEAKDRVIWLEKRLEKLLAECEKKASDMIKSSAVSCLGRNLAQTHLAKNKDKRLTSLQCERMFADVGGYLPSTDNDKGRKICYNVVNSIVYNSKKLVNCEAVVSSLDSDVKSKSKLIDKCPEIARPIFELKNTLQKEDKDEEYCQSDHHRLESEQNAHFSLSWHSLRLSLQDSFVKINERPSFIPDLPWNEKALQVNSVLDIHKIALDKLHARLHNIYELIERATEASRNLNDDVMTTRMRNFEGTKIFPKITSKISVCEKNKLKKAEELSENVEYTSRTAARKEKKLTYPRNPSVWCMSKRRANGEVVKKIKTKPPQLPSKTTELLTKKHVESNEINAKQLEKQEAMIWRPSIVYKMVKASKVLKILKAQLQQWDLSQRCSEQKRSRVEWLIGKNGLGSANKGVIIESLKSIGFLRCSEDVASAIEIFLHESKDPRILYEASKALILSGHWHPSAIKILHNALKFGSKSLKQEILETLYSVDNIPFFDKFTQPFQEILTVLEELVNGDEESLSFYSSLCLGRLFVVHPLAQTHLLKVIKMNRLNSTQKTLAFNVLVRQMNSKDIVVVESLLYELSTSHNWKLRVEACDLLIFIGNRHVLVKDADEIFAILERLLWDHGHQEVRSKVAQLLNTLRMKKRACNLVFRRLEDKRETVRARAIIAMTALEMKGEKELKALLDILALDSSLYARIQVVRLFSKLNWNDTRILRSLKEKERGEGTLAREARRALEKLC